MKNELALVDKIEKRLRLKREPVVFPLTPTHRKELRDLRNKNIGDLRDRLSNLRELKKEEYIKKYFIQIKKEFKYTQGICDDLNDDWLSRIKSINKLLVERKKLEEKHDVSLFKLKNSYGILAELKEVKSEDRKFTFNEDHATNDLAEKEFNKKYGASFKFVSDKIDDLHTKYEEAINFGDLEIVKELYYVMKNADIIFEKISKLQV